ncbi:VOC family protein [Streptomyces sp. NBC_00257]|uniref:VOC family protein n=1 Tax=unclassified Streptomyces TaxID=2593676 RepID=UPI0022552800|nr:MULTISPECIES: VOC family protein [unclassified Streptomyces]WTB55234.1 VOC family protein [Streptomyces sp. NBC_00826]WTH91882.1 VOC family protein [Streptomyces sp. NBC_00825]WTI00610.1 VOC family protein [Streptomyces sp. NBC_00822]MCX4866120.1 VOC family protein [Streptomyces sp. NBC_00906]MCX4897359.1 VOC family protein [Streptomyces sp. NBC_00892]
MVVPAAHHGDTEAGPSGEDYASLADGEHPGLAFVRIEGYRAPGWPDGAKHVHLDFTVPDLEEATGRILALGASRPEFQPGKDQWVVLSDPEGHPFCLTTGA